MTWDPYTKRYMHLSRELCVEQISEANSVKKMLKSLIQEKALEEQFWKDNLMPLLCECFATTNQYGELLFDIMVKAPPNEERPEYLKVDSRKADALRAHASLLRLGEFELQHNHGISLTIH